MLDGEGMANARQMQTTGPIEAFSLVMAYKGGSAEALVALAGDLSLPEADAGTLRDAPTATDARRSFFARRGLARRAVARRLKCDASSVEIARDADGAPRLLAPSCGLHVSLSSRDELVAAAVADHAVGVDVEAIGAAFDAPVNVLHPAERAAIEAAGESGHECFLRIWTAKEAYLKALGLGLAREPSEIEIRFGPGVPSQGSILLRGADDVVVVDRGRRVGIAAGFAQRLTYCGRPLALACIVLA